MKTFGISMHGWYMSMFMFLTGRDYYSLPDNTCSLFWESMRMFILSPLLLFGSIFYYLDSSSTTSNGLWFRIGSTFMISMIYLMLLMVGSGVWGSYMMDLPEKELAFLHVNWFAAYVGFPLLGVVILAIPIGVLGLFGYGVYQGSKVVKEKYQDAAEENFGIEIDKESALPKNKFWAILYMVHDKTCAKIDWTNE